MSRRETFERTRPDGEVVVIERDIDTGEQTVTVKVEVESPESVEQVWEPGDSPVLPSVPADPSIEQVALDVAPAEPTEPRGNASREDWATWATFLEVEYPEDAKRDDIKALILSAFE